MLIRNLFLLEEIDLFVAEEEKILRLIDAVPSILENERQVFLDNVNRIICPSDPAFLSRHVQVFNDANCFSFNTIMDDDIRVWEERELLNMLAVSVKDGKVVPKVSWGESFSPDYTIWSKGVLAHINDYFDSPDVTFILESIGYLLHGDIPSADTINKHFALLYELSEKTEENYFVTMSCSSLEIILIFFSKKYTSCITDDSYKKYGVVLKKLYDKDCKHLLRKLMDYGALTDKTIIRKINEEIITYRDKVEEINDYAGFTQYIQNDFIRGAITNSHFEVLAERFGTIVTKVGGVRLAHLFLSYFMFLLQIKNNKDVIASKISLEIIKIRTLWQEEYYDKSCAGMNTVKTGPILIPKEFSGQLLDFILVSPTLFAKQRMKLQDNILIDRMQMISDSPLSIFVSKIMISKDFPARPVFKLDEKHPIDQLYSENVDRVRKANAYKFRNNFTAKEYTGCVFEGIKREMQMYMSLLEDIETLYAAVAVQNPEYAFLDYSTDLQLAHITQLFPVLEAKIRQFGELFGIVPVRENIEECHRLKEPDTVLRMIISRVIEMGGNLSDASDLYFIHFCMFGENGLNIRNACVHGLDYCQGNQLMLGFKTTLVSLYMIGWRMQLVLENIKKNEDSPEEVNEEVNKNKDTAEIKESTECKDKGRIWAKLTQFVRKILGKR